ncbi:MAG: gliding motility protein GldN [Chitinophagaceae bacterium]
MKNRIIKSLLLLTLVAGVAETADAQTRRRTTRTNTTNNAAANNNAVQNTPPPADTVKKLPPPPPELKLDTIRKSLRNDNAIERNLVKERTPLAYEHIREDDAVYRQRVWRELDVREKINMPFVYKANEDNGNQRFISILLNALKNGGDSITAFSPIDDRFTTPITMGEITKTLVGEPKTVQVRDWNADPDGSKDIFKDSVIIDEFNPEAIEKYWIKEDVVFDKESSRLYTRILGIAPLKNIYNSDGSFRDVTPIFWVYYPDLRPMLARYEVFNGKNFGSRMSWEELFESRMFSARIIKTTMDNPYDRYIADYVKDPILRLLEGDAVKERIFNYEQDLWSY